jgi:hypothetical protein
MMIYLAIFVFTDIEDLILSCIMCQELTVCELTERVIDEHLSRVWNHD